MIDAYYERRAPLPTELSALFRLCGAQSEGERQAVISVSKEFFTNGDGLLRHLRCDEQISKEGKLIEEWREAGKRGAEKRWGKDRVGYGVAHQNPNGVAIASYTQPQTQTYTQPEPQSKKSKTRAQPTPFSLPDWIPADHWNAWVEARAKARKSPTDYAKRLAVLKLDNYRKQGHPPAQVLMQSAFNNWAGLFPPKEIK